MTRHGRPEPTSTPLSRRQRVPRASGGARRLAERPDGRPEQHDVLQEELPRDDRERWEAAKVGGELHAADPADDDQTVADDRLPHTLQADGSLEEPGTTVACPHPPCAFDAAGGGAVSGATADPAASA